VTRIPGSSDGQIDDDFPSVEQESILLSQAAARPRELSPADVVIFHEQSLLKRAENRPKNLAGRERRIWRSRL
jgi:hypothetical protein